MLNGFANLGKDVVLVEGDQYLAPQAAAYWLLMKAAAAKDGVNLTINEGYRTYARQVYYRQLYLAGKGNPAGIPGTSKHGLGLAVDVFLNPGVFEWLTANAAKYGFTWTQGRADNEKWHWVFDGTPTIPLPKKKEASRQMPDRYVLNTNPKQIALAWPGCWDAYIRDDKNDGNRAPVEFKFFGTAKTVTQAEWDTLKRLYETPSK